MKRRRRLQLASFVSVALVAVLNGVVLRRGDPREAADDTSARDCAIVLGAGVSADGTPSWVLEDRLRTSLDLYRDAVAPRLMRQICSAVGSPIALDVDWEGLGGDEQAIRGLWSWGLNRVLGAVAIAYPQAGERPPEGWLHTIRIGFSVFEHELRAKCEEGVLDMVIVPRYGEKGCLYEQALCQVLCGEPVGGATDESGEPPTE